MNNTRTYTIAELNNLLDSLDGADFKPEDKADAYKWIEGELYRYKYSGLDKPSKGVVRKYLCKYTNYSQSQLSRLISKWKSNKHIKPAVHKRNSFATIYTRADIVLLANTDTAHNLLSGPATKHIFKREYQNFGHSEYAQLANISVSHLYNLRGTYTYRNTARVFTRTSGPKNTLGERRKPEPNGKPGYIRVDTVHQGDSTDGKKGVYHINFVDETTQWELVAAVETICDRDMLPMLESILEQFPFTVYEFHSDNGSEFINKKVLAMLKRLHADLTKSRPRRHNDNALVETKNGSVIRKLWGYNHIPACLAPVVNGWYKGWFNTYLNYHRPCGFATVKYNKKGKEKRVYLPQGYMTPYEKLQSLPAAESYLKEGISFDLLNEIAYAMGDTEFALLMEQARDALPLTTKL